MSGAKWYSAIGCCKNMRRRSAPRMRLIVFITLVVYVILNNHFKKEQPLKEQYHDYIIERIKDGTYDTAPFDKRKLISAFFRYNERFESLHKLTVEFPKPSVVERPCKEHFIQIPHLTIKKVATTINTAVICYINNRTAFLANNRRISKETFKTRFCGYSNHYTNITTVQNLLGERRIEYATIRNPISRFLSGYTDKCINEGRVDKEICFGCQDNMGCFLVNLYSLMETIQLSIDRGHTLELNHFTPQTWYCNFREKLQDYIIIRYEEHENRTKKFGDDLSMVFQKAGVPEYVREEIQHEVKGGITAHATTGSKDRIRAERTLMSNKTLLTLFTQIYYYDFIVFNYELPTIL